jgi:hypothetical protein
MMQREDFASLVDISIDKSSIRLPEDDLFWKTIIAICLFS